MHFKMKTIRHIRPAREEDIPTILKLVDHSRSLMRANGNTIQWTHGYPGETDISEDIENGIGYVIEEANNIIGSFALLTTPEPTYAYIEGKWLDDSTPYGTLHRLTKAPGSHNIAQDAFDWCEQQSVTLRADTHADNAVMLHILQKRGYTRCGVVYMADKSPREAYQKMLYPMVSPTLKTYIEQKILPRYEHFDAAHRPEHVQTVMAQSMELAQHYPELDLDMVYTIAAYHDTGIVEGREYHHIVSGRIIREDTTLREWFTPDQIETMAQAAEDHRASSDHDPRSLYGMIVAEADRDILPEKIVLRTVQYGLSHFPELDKEGHWQRTLQHLDEKYAPNGYLKLYIPFSRNAEEMKKLWALIADKERLRELFEKIYSMNKNN